MIRPLLLALLFVTSAFGQEISGISSSPIPAQKLTEKLSLAVISKEPAKTLHWQITRDKHVSGEGADTMTAGEAVLPGEEYAYYWDKEKQVLWFATLRSLMRLNLANWASTESHFRSTSGFDAFEDIPAAFRENVKTILETRRFTNDGLWKADLKH